MIKFWCNKINYIYECYLLCGRYGFPVFVRDDHMIKLQGSIIGWKENLMEEGFDIDNPQAVRSCGCGESVDIVIKEQEEGAA